MLLPAPSLFNAINKASQRDRGRPQQKRRLFSTAGPQNPKASPSSLLASLLRPTAMALDSVPSYPSDLGSSSSRATRQQRIRYAPAVRPANFSQRKVDALRFSFLIFLFCSYRCCAWRRQEGGADVDGGHLRAVRRWASMEEVRREEALQLQLPEVWFLAGSAVRFIPFPQAPCFSYFRSCMCCLCVVK